MAAAAVEFQRAQSLLSTDRNASIDILHAIVKRDVQDSDEEAVRVKEQSILELGGLLAKTGQAAELGGLLKYVRPFLNSISKAKAARLVRSLLDLFLDMEAATGQEVELCEIGSVFSTVFLFIKSPSINAHSLAVIAGLILCCE
uniref:Proteasome 26S subunit, non-ATPase 11 n=1 Tax=Astyanax mexicanus TaxID=7994 RepID=A0A8B9HWR2_ASTMX